MIASRLLPPILACALLPLPVIGWIVVQGAEERIQRNSEFTGALIHTLSASTFAVILLLSALANALIVSLRFRDEPRSYRLTGLVLWQAILLVVTLSWVVVAAVNNQFSYVEFALGVVIAVVSIVVCVFASKRDQGSVERRDARRGSRTPEMRRRMRLAGILIPSALLLLGIAVAAVVQNVEMVHRGCVIIGHGSVNGADSIYTEECGNFALDDSVSLADAEFGPVMITSRGYRLLPWEPIAITVEPVD